MNVLNYSNGWAHVTISIISMILGALLIFFSNNAAAQGAGIGIITTVVSAWYIPGAAKQMASEMQASVNAAMSTPTPDAAPEPMATTPLPVVKTAPPPPAVQLPPAPPATTLPPSIPQDGSKG